MKNEGKNQSVVFIILFSVDRTTDRQMRYNNRWTDRTTDRQTDVDLWRERSLGAGLCVCMPQAGLFRGGLGLQTCSSAGLPLTVCLLFMEQQRLKALPLQHTTDICISSSAPITLQYMWKNMRLFE